MIVCLFVCPFLYWSGSLYLVYRGSDEQGCQYTVLDGGSVSTSIPPPISGEKVLQERSVLASLPIDPLYTRH